MTDGETPRLWLKERKNDRKRARRGEGVKDLVRIPLTRDHCSTPVTWSSSHPPWRCAAMRCAKCEIRRMTARIYTAYYSDRLLEDFRVFPEHVILRAEQSHRYAHADDRRCVIADTSPCGTEDVAHAPGAWTVTKPAGTQTQCSRSREDAGASTTTTNNDVCCSSEVSPSLVFFSARHKEITMPPLRTTTTTTQTDAVRVCFEAAAAETGPQARPGDIVSDICSRRDHHESV